METTRKTEYEVHLSHYAVNGTERWKAFVEAFPEITAEGPTCEVVLEEIGEKLQSSLATAGNAASPITEPEPDAQALPQSELAARLKAQGHACYGIFADDPGALEVFDEIERLRDEHTVGGA